MTSSGSGSSGGHKPTTPLRDYKFDFGLEGLSSSKPLASLKDHKQQGTGAGQSFSAAKPGASWTGAPASQLPQIPMGASSGTRSSFVTAANSGSKGWMPTTEAARKGSIGSAGKDMFGDLLGGVMAEGALNQAASSSMRASNSVTGSGSLRKSVPLRQSIPPSSTASVPSSRPSVPASSRPFVKDAVPPMRPPSGNADPFRDFVSFPNFATPSSAKPAAAPSLFDPFDVVDPLCSTSAGEDGAREPLRSLRSSVPAAANPSPRPNTSTDSFGLWETLEKKPVSSSIADPFSVFHTDSLPTTTTARAIDPLDALSSRSRPSVAATSQKQGSIHPSDGWDQLGGGVSSDSGGGKLTTELEDLGAVPAGVTGSSANRKGSEFFRQGQFPDAIKWLSWAVELLDKSGEKPQLEEVLTCRISCYKEVGEYRKAVADCSKVLEMDKLNTNVLMQRAFLYESMEKYRLSVDDFKEVLRRDPNQKVAANTLTRLLKVMARPSFNL